jgi:23S rRNA pseudouridine1911/1915/1917 synthase
MTTRALMDVLVEKYPTAKRQTLRRMVEEGRVSINGRPARSVKAPVEDAAGVHVREHVPRQKAGIAPLHIIHEDEDVLVIYKPPGLLTSTVARERRPTVIAIVRAYLADHHPRARAGVIHRLDRDAAGLLVVSKNDDAYTNLKRQFFHHSVERIYTAVVHGKPTTASGRIESLLVELPDGSMRSTHNPAKGQEAVTEWQLVRSVGRLSLLRVKLQTGRKHQIRAHLSQRGMSIVGDTVYGHTQNPEGMLLLAATTLAFDHPRTGSRMTFEVPPPEEIQKAIP